ncbi:MAG: hypothetical protein CR982_06150 [Candidatus Cloacimonadota bacterium]|nr:MAG: hypothetical protein CR982_06150 [Candidatus Cloacimonadota bacterium]PIE78102.1 MAG: hypothetical protein CSA15_09710 [Candidatus Delongbacteria bacterium]
MKVLIVNLTRMGDILQTTPLIYNYKSRGDIVDYLAVKGFGKVLKSTGLINELFEISVAEEIKALILKDYNRTFFSIKEKIEVLNNQVYDLVINLTHTDESRSITSFIKAKEYRGIVTGVDGGKVIIHPWEIYFYVSNLNRGLNKINLVDIYNRIGNFESTPKRLFYNVDDKDIDSVKSKFKNFYTIQLGASVDNKRWRGENFIETASKIYRKYKLIPAFVGVESERPLLETIISRIDFPYYDLIGKTSIGELAAILKLSKFLLTNDTGTMHIGAAVGVKIICIALATAYSHETSPYSEGNFIIEADIECTPCSSKIVCTNPVCKNYINSDHILGLLPSILEGKEIDISKYDKVKLFKTEFDQYNNLTLKELTNRDENKIYRELFYHIVVNSFGFKNYSSLSVSENKVVEIANLIIKSKVDTIPLKDLKRNMLYLKEKALIGLKLSETMEDLFKKERYDDLVKAAKEIEELDSNIVNFGFSHIKLRIITFMFQIEKENMDSNDTGVIINYTLKIYLLLLKRVSLGLDIIDYCLKQS